MASTPFPRNGARMRERLKTFSTTLKVGDRLFLATDAVAAWMVRSASTDGSRLWAGLDELHHPDQFDALAQEHLASGRLKNDDLTLMRVEVTGQPAQQLLVCAPEVNGVAATAAGKSGARR